MRSHALCSGSILVLCTVAVLLNAAHGFWFPNGESRRAVSDASGRFVVFQTTATNLIFDDTNDFEDIFLWDTRATANSSAALQLLTRGRLGTASRGLAEYGILSDDASHAFFVGMATNYVADPVITCAMSLIYQVDLLASNASNSLVTRLISIAPNGTLPSKPTYLCGTSWNGRFVVFHTADRIFLPRNVSLAPGLTPTSELVYWMDTLTGETRLVSHHHSENHTANGISLCHLRRSISESHGPGRAMSADGRWVVFHSRANNLVDQSISGNWNVYAYDTVLNATQLISGSRMQSSPGNVSRSVYNYCRSPSLASNATSVAFWCQRSEFQQGGMLVFDTVVCDFSDDVNAPLNCSVLSVNTSGLVSLSQYTGPETSGAPSLSSSGRFVAWATTGNDIISDPNSRGRNELAQPSRVVIRDRETGVTSWAVRRPTPDDSKEYRPWLTADGSQVFFEGNSPSYLPGVNATSIQQIYYDTINATVPLRDRPVAWECPYPDPSECAKVALQLRADIVELAASADSEIVAFSTFQPDFMDPTDEIYRGYVCAARVCNSPPTGHSELSAYNGYLAPDQRNGTFVYLRSTFEEVSDIVGVDRRNRTSQSPVLLPWVKLYGITGDGRFVVHQAESTIGYLPQHTEKACTKALYVYDSVRREHEPVFAHVNGGCIGNISLQSVSVSGRYIVVVASGAEISSGLELPVHSSHNVFLYDTLTKTITVESTNASLVDVKNSTTGEIIGQKVVQVPVTFPCDSAQLSDDARWIAFRCFVNNASQTFIRDRSSENATLEPISINSTGHPWQAACEPVAVSHAGRFVVFQCNRWGTDGTSVITGSPWTSSSLLEVAVVVLDRSASEYSSRVFVVPPARPLTGCGLGSHRILAPVISPQELNFFVIAAYNAPLGTGSFSSVPIRWFHSSPFESRPMFADKDSPVGVYSISSDGSKAVVATTSFLLAPYDVNGRLDAYVVPLSASTNVSGLLVTARDNYFTSTLPNFNCPGLRPQPRFECIDGVWTLRPQGLTRTVILRSDIDIRNGSAAATVGNTAVLVAGSVRIGCNATFLLGANTSILLSDQLTICGTLNATVTTGGTFVVEALGCASLGGTFDVTVDVSQTRPVNASTDEIGLIGFAELCPASGTTQVNVRPVNTDPCEIFASRVEQRSTGLYLVFSITPSQEERCRQPSSNNASTDGAFGVIAWAIPVAILVLAVAAVVVILAVPALRHKVFPFMNRRKKSDPAHDEEELEGPAPVSKKTRAQANQAGWLRSNSPVV